MIPELGHFALALAVVIAGAQAVLPLFGAHARDARLMQTAPALAIGQFIALATAYGCLVWSAVVDDFSVANVVENSNSLKPLIYKITGTWGNHEGSILLWCLILALCGGAVAAFGRALPSSLRARVIGVLGFTSAGFLLFALTTSNPLERVWPPPIDGRDMNPLLQDPGLALHPPVLYAGYVGFAIPFAFAVAALLEGRVDAAWGRWVRPWTLAAWCLLTGGIALGSWWAYYELGWGGYWFWDPVENASLLPWLSGTALLHSAIVVEKREALKIWTILLAIGTFSLSLCGTFLVRSGILNSVHSFANDPTRGVFILALLAIVIGGSLLLFALRAPVMAPTGIFAPISREGALVLNNILLCSICAVVLTGTTYPLFAELVFGAKLSVGPPYFQSDRVPAGDPAVRRDVARPGAAVEARRTLAGAAETVVGGADRRAGRHRDGARAARRPRRAGLRRGGLADRRRARRTGRTHAAVPCAVRHGPRAPWPRSRCRCGDRPWRMPAWASRSPASPACRSPPARSSRCTRVRACGLAATTGRCWRCATSQGPNYTARVADIRVSRGGDEIAMFHPSRRMFTVQKTTVTDTAIQTNGLRDLYAVLGEERDGAAVLRLHVNPLAPWIWFGALVMAAGGALSLADRRLRVGAPARRAAAVRAGVAS